MILKLFTLFLIRLTICQDVPSKRDRQEKAIYNDNPYGKPSYRRFLDDLHDKDWHLAHLRETDNLQQSECAGDTLEDKIKKYRKALKNDAGRVEYVYADPLPFDKSDFYTSEKCVATNSQDLSTAKDNGPQEHSKNLSSITISNITTKSNIKVPEEVNSATTVKIDSKPKVSESNTTDDAKKIRRSEYQYSSIEYYDENIDFDDDMCPDAVEVIKLQEDQLRNYDVECELILEWRSLDS